MRMRFVNEGLEEFRGLDNPFPQAQPIIEVNIPINRRKSHNRLHNLLHLLKAKLHLLTQIFHKLTIK